MKILCFSAAYTRAKATGLPRLSSARVSESSLTTGTDKRLRSKFCHTARCRALSWESHANQRFAVHETLARLSGRRLDDVVHLPVRPACVHGGGAFRLARGAAAARVPALDDCDDAGSRSLRFRHRHELGA